MSIPIRMRKREFQEFLRCQNIILKNKKKIVRMYYQLCDNQQHIFPIYVQFLKSGKELLHPSPFQSASDSHGYFIHQLCPRTYHKRENIEYIHVG